jgi:exonuclease III
MTDFSLITFNIFGRKCPNFYSIDKYIDKYNPNIICTQEDFGKEQYLNIGDYKSITKLYNFLKLNGVYKKENNLTEIIKCISTNPIKLKYASKRYAIVFSYENLIIANIHLEGGRYVDESLLENFDKLMSYKIELLYKLINDECKPDIIVGDFNSVYNTNTNILEKYLDGQYLYFEKKKKSKLTNNEKDNIKMWNLSPILFLIKNGYEYAIPKNENKAITNGRGNTIVDFIFYKKDKLKVIDCEIIDVMKDIRNYYNPKAISDHNPIYANFKII